MSATVLYVSLFLDEYVAGPDSALARPDGRAAAMDDAQVGAPREFGEGSLVRSSDPTGRVMRCRPRAHEEG